MNLQYNRSDKQRTPHRSCRSQRNPNPEVSSRERLLGSSEFFLDNRAWQSKTTKPVQGCTG